GVLKAGGAYVPLDPAYPPERISFILRDAHLSLILTQQHVYERLPISHDVQMLCLDTDWERIVTTATSTSFTYPALRLENLAYVIYTSGSTGKPKGAGASHQGLLNLLHWYRMELAMTEQDRTLVVTSFSFDLTQKDLLMPLLTGGAVHLIPSGYYDPAFVR